MSAEDDLASTIAPRLDAMGADTTKITALTWVLDGKNERLPTVADLDALRAAIADTGAKLVVVDPIMAYLPGDVKAHNDQDVRRALHPLSVLAEETGCAIIAVRHLNKSSGSNPTYRGGGSIAFTGAARSVLLVAKDPGDETEERRVLAVSKCNLAKRPPALAYHIEASTLPAEAGAADAVYVKWEGAVEYTARELLTEPGRDEGEKRPALEEAKVFLLEVLKDAPRLATAIYEEAEQQRISRATLLLAKKALDVEARRQGGLAGEGHWVWVLPRSTKGAKVP